MPDGSNLLLALCMFLGAALYSSVGHAGASAYLALMALFATPQPTSAADAEVKDGASYHKKIGIHFSVPSDQYDVRLTDLKFDFYGDGRLCEVARKDGLVLGALVSVAGTAAAVQAHADGREQAWSKMPKAE